MQRFLLWLMMLNFVPLSGMGDEIDFSAPEHDYWNRPLRDPFTMIKADLEAGKLGLDDSSEKAFLESLLVALEIPVSTQMLVYSTTSLQLRFISPKTPRAIYFSEDIYLGYVPGGRIEIVSIDPDLGGIFYIFDIPQRGVLPEVERSTRCMNCHSDDDTRQVPGIVIKSVIPGVRGGSLESYRRSTTGHQIPLKDRFGGWHVTGGEAISEHWGNLVGQFTPEGIVTTPLLPGERFDWSMFPVATSDVLAHLLHEHQAGFVNRVLEAHYLARSYLSEGGGRLSSEQRAEMERQADEVVRYLLFADEAALPNEGLKGDSVLVEEFLETRRPDTSGDSLKDLDLKTRIFRNRCSYMIYSRVFTGLPDGFKKLIFTKLSEALSAENPDSAFAYLPGDEKARIRAILLETLPDLPENW